jgi:hypothetical protein
MKFANKWMDLENIIFSEVRLRRLKIVCSPSHGDFRPKTNAVILLDMSHMLKGEHIHEVRKVGNLKLESI